VDLRVEQAAEPDKEKAVLAVQFLELQKLALLDLLTALVLVEATAFVDKVGLFPEPTHWRDQVVQRLVELFY